VPQSHSKCKQQTISEHSQTWLKYFTTGNSNNFKHFTIKYKFYINILLSHLNSPFSASATSNEVTTNSLNYTEFYNKFWWATKRNPMKKSHKFPNL